MYNSKRIVLSFTEKISLRAKLGSQAVYNFFLMKYVHGINKFLVKSGVRGGVRMDFCLFHQFKDKYFAIDRAKKNLASHLTPRKGILYMDLQN